MRLEVGDDENIDEHEEEETDEHLYVVVGTEEQAQLVHRDVLDIFGSNGESMTQGDVVEVQRQLVEFVNFFDKSMHQQKQKMAGL